MFTDRTEAGHRLADRLESQDVEADVVLGITRGGVPVARVVAERLGCPLGVVVVQKIGTPRREELALGAVSSDGTAWFNDDLVAELGVDESVFANRREQAEASAAEKAAHFRTDRETPDVSGKRVLVVDDGVATGATACAALRATRERGASEVILAVPVGAPSSLEMVGREADDVVAVATPEPFGAVGRFYDRFDQVTDEEVREALTAAA
ncbi:MULTISPECIES: phosphoribosyltransferase [Salinibaculum]|uniref:phosphoribosyltransferase n=1 Tax=Salinibaculum TaxID=2732368 RepID=UPI0030D4CD0B